MTARELSLDEIRTIRDKTNPDLEIEVFVHGAMCMSFSGRCILSDYMVGRDANRGIVRSPAAGNIILLKKHVRGSIFLLIRRMTEHIFLTRAICV